MEPYYDNDSVTIYHGDCRDVLPNISGVNTVVTSPPYNQMNRLDKGGIWAKTHSGAGFVQNWHRNGYHDSMPEPEYQAGQIAVFESILDACKPNASMFYNHQCRWRDKHLIHPVAWFRPVGWRLRQDIIWDRGGGMLYNARMFNRFDERILWFVRGDEWQWHGSVFGTVWRVTHRKNKAHPVGWPLEIPMRCIMATTGPGDLVLDPYMGGGTAMVAAANVGRRAVGIEIEERYCEIAAEALSQTHMDLGG